MLKPLSFEITIDEKEIQAAKVIKICSLLLSVSFIVYLLPSSIANPVNFLSPDHQWMPLEEFVKQPFYLEDDMSRKVVDICIKAHEDRFNGFIAHELASKLDGKLSCLYHNDYWLGENLGYQTCVWCTTENVHIIILCNMHTIWERSCISIWIMPQTKEQWYSDHEKKIKKLTFYLMKFDLRSLRMQDKFYHPEEAKLLRNQSNNRLSLSHHRPETTLIFNHMEHRKCAIMLFCIFGYLVERSAIP